MKVTDCLIIGGGPAGLTAALYLARFRLTTVLIDSGKSRGLSIVKTRNFSGFPEGISGPLLLKQMRQQAELYGNEFCQGEVRSLKLEQGIFYASGNDFEAYAQTVLLATGVTDNRPPQMRNMAHAMALSDGRLRYCPICDGYEVTDQKIAVLGTGRRGYDEVLFLRSYSADLTLVAPEGGHNLTTEQQSVLANAQINIAGSCSNIRLQDHKVVLETEDGIFVFDSLYPALGSIKRSELARQLGADVSEEGCLIVDAHQRTSVPGLYAAGDIVLGLDQISNAIGQSSVAATSVRNDLASRRLLWR